MRRTRPWPRCQPRLRRVLFGERAALPPMFVVDHGYPPAGMVRSVCSVEPLGGVPPEPAPPVKRVDRLDLRNAPSSMEQLAAGWRRNG